MKAVGKTLRDIISEDEKDQIIFGYEILSQPDPTILTRIPHITHRNQAIATIAKEGDIVLLNQPINQQYQQWLREVGFGTDAIHEVETDGQTPITELVTDLRFKIPSQEGTRIYVPRMVSDTDHDAASALNAVLFGGNTDLVLKYYDKGEFKTRCQELEIPVVEFRVLEAPKGIKVSALSDAIREILETSEGAIVKAMTSSAGADTYRVNKENIAAIAETVVKEGKTRVIVEALAKVRREYSSQWAVDLKGNVNLVGICNMHADQKGSHIGNTYPTPQGVLATLTKYSHRVGTDMSEQGYIGNFQLDLFETEHGILMSENNTRMSGSSIAWDVFHRLNHRHKKKGVFISTKFQVPPNSFDCIKESCRDIIYTGRDYNCFFPYDIGAIDITGQFMGVIIAEDQEKAKSILKEIERKGIKSSISSEYL